jgi:hypothetical protein
MKKQFTIAFAVGVFVGILAGVFPGNNYIVLAICVAAGLLYSIYWSAWLRKQSDRNVRLAGYILPYYIFAFGGIVGFVLVFLISGQLIL